MMKFLLYCFDGEDTAEISNPPENAYQETKWERDTIHFPERLTQYAALDENGNPVIRMRPEREKPNKKWFSTGRNHNQETDGLWVREIEVSHWYIDFQTLDEFAVFMQRGFDVSFGTIPPSINLYEY